ncbi:hypothetical protein SKAU_G00096570 [Synaphobranchus kaupii]|uniref:Uncharacterized protein n=1 Tax=Synaphobranchus kaupii TaxID=118154 RepID=A0A9Q1FYB1_SYNKA|nr:hypothetical protein SKAU_G00096570 [Synaphobranchus kaupii]
MGWLQLGNQVPMVCMPAYEWGERMEKQVAEPCVLKESRGSALRNYCGGELSFLPIHSTDQGSVIECSGERDGTPPARLQHGPNLIHMERHCATKLDFSMVRCPGPGYVWASVHSFLTLIPDPYGTTEKLWTSHDPYGMTD